MSDWKLKWHLGPSLLMYGTMGAIIIWVLSGTAMAQTYPSRTICTSVGGPIQLGTKDVTIGLKCCPAGSYIADPNNPVLDKQGNLICYREKT